MGQKVNPIIFRLGEKTGWSSNWFAKKDYAKLLVSDIKIRNFLNEKMSQFYISKVLINRDKNAVTLTIFTARPGMIIGRAGAGITALKSSLSKMVDGELKINVEEVKEPNLDARLVAMNIANQIEKRIAYKRAAKQSIARVMESGALGVKVICKGRLAGAEIARVESMSQGSLPLGTLDADIDYGQVAAKTTYGIIGIKVWINKVIKEK